MKQKMKAFFRIRIQALNLGRKISDAGIFLVLMILLTVPVQSAFSQPGMDISQSATVAWDIQEVNAPPYYYNMTNRSLAYKNDYIPCVAYGYEALYYSCYDAVNETWNTETIDSDMRVGEYAALAFNNQSDPNATSYPFISYFDAENGRLKLAYNLGTGWIKYVVDSPPIISPEEAPAPKERTFQDEINDFLQPWFSPGLGGDAPDIDIESFGIGKYTSIDVDNNNVIHISYYDEVNRRLKYARWDGANWDYKIVHDYTDQGVTGLWTSIIVDINFNVHISYRDEKYNNLRYSKRKATGGWIHEDVDTNGDVGSFTSVAVDSNNIPYISYYDVGNGNLKIAKRNGNDNWAKDKVDDGGVVGWYTSLAITSLDKIKISYYKPSAGTLKYAHRAADETSWNIKTLVEKSKTNLGLFTSIALGEDELAGVVYFNLTDGNFNYINRKEGSGWNDPITIAENSRDVGQATSLAINKDDIPYISYLDATAGNLMLARWFGSGSGWANSTLLLEPHAGLYSSIKLGNGYYPQIAFYNSDEKNLMYAGLDNVGWRFENIDTVNKVGKYVSMALDSNQTQHISYYDATTQDLMYATWNSVWYTQTLDFEGDVGLYTSIILDSNDKPYISYYDADKNILKIAYKSPIGAWIIDTVDDGGVGDEPDVGQYTSIGLESNGYPLISYYDATNGNLKYAYWNGAVWVTTVIDSSVNDVGMFSSLVIDPATRDSHVSYLDLTDGDLKYAFWDYSGGGPWVIETVDSEGDVGYYCFIDLNSNGDPAISYYDNTLGNLMIALGYTLPPTPILPEFRFLPLIFQGN